MRKLLLFLILLNCCAICAKDFGVLGDVYVIKEMDFLEFIKDKFKKMEQNGGLKKMQEQMTARVKEHIYRPPPVLGMTRAIKTRRWQFNTAFTLVHDMMDHKGRILAHSGEKYNPLHLTPWHNIWIFYDADDKTQVAWVSKEDKKLQGKDKLILVNGSIAAQMQLFHKRIYFDQYGKLTTKLGIKHVPAEVHQQGEGLEIVEIVP